MPSSRTNGQGGAAAPITIVLLSFACAVAASWFRLPGFIFLWGGIALAGFFSPSVSFTGTKGSNGYPTAANARETAAMQHSRFWSELRWRLFAPTPDWLPNALDDLPAFRLSKKVSGKPFLFILDALGFVLWLLIPLRILRVAALGLAFIAFTLPTDGWDLRFVWVNAAVAYVTVMQLEVSGRRFADADEPSPGVTFAALISLVKKDPGKWRGVAGILILAGVTGAGTFWALLHYGLGWLIVPTWLTGVGVFVTVAAGLMHILARATALQPWRNTIAARAAWKPRWEGLKQNPTLIRHERVGPNEIVVDTFEAPATLSAQGALALYSKVLPFMGSGVKVAMLAVPDVNADGQPIPGSKHPNRFRVVAWPDGTFPNITAPETQSQELTLFLECAVFWALTQAQQFQPVLLDVQPISEPPADEADQDTTMAYQSTWALTEMSAASALKAGQSVIADLIGAEVVVDTPNGIPTLFFGAISAETTRLHNPELLDRFEELEVEARWEQRWRDLLKVGEKPPVLQYAFHRESKLNETTTIQAQPFLVKQGLDPTAFFNQYVKKGLATTLRAAPFVTVTGYPAVGLRPGDRHPQGFTVIWSHQPVPTSPSDISPGAERQAARWAIAGAINDAFDAAKLNRPEVVSVTPLTHKDGFTHIWKITLRLYDGVTAAMVKNASEKLRLAMGACSWLRVTESIDGCDIFAGADPKSPNVVFATPKKPNQDKCIALDWEQAFMDAKVVSPADGAAPQLVKSDVLPTNNKVQVLEFSLPRGLQATMIREVRGKLSGSTGNAFIEVRPGGRPETFVLLVCKENPMPFPARFDWDEIATNPAIPFATGVEGEPVVFDIQVDPHLLVLGGTGSGKAQPLDTLIPVPVSERFPSGWATNVDLSVGDLIIGADGNPTTIIGFTRARVEPVYILTLDDGQEVRASGHHLWKVTDRASRKTATPSRTQVRTVTQELLLARAAELEKLAVVVGPEVGTSLESIAKLSGVSAGIIYKSGAAPKSLSRLVLEKTKKSAAVFEMRTVLDYARAVAANRGVFTLCGTTLTSQDIDDLQLEGTWLSARGIADAFLGRASTRNDRDAVKQVIRRANAASRPGFERRLVPFYPTDEILTRLASYYRVQAGHHSAPGTTVLTTEEMYRRATTASGHSNFAIETADAFEGPEADVPVPPYLLGAWLGDGSSAVGGITVGGDYLNEMTALLTAEWAAPHRVEHKRGTSAQTLHFGRRQPELCEHGCTDRMPSGGCRPHSITTPNMSLGRALSQLGITTARGGKRIPPSYLRSSKQQRLSLLQGIMDTDGSINTAGNAELTLCNKNLALDCLELVRSLGIKASMSSGPAALTETDPENPGKTRRRVVGTRWRLRFTTTMPVFRLAAKLSRLPRTTRSSTRQLYVTGIRITEPVAQRCIRVAEPHHTYLTDGFVPTHNSAVLQNLLTVSLIRGYDVYAADPTKLAADFGYAEPWLKAIAIDELTASAMMNHIYAEVDRRRALNGKFGVATYRDLPEEVRPPHVVIIIDEFTSLMFTDPLSRPAADASEQELRNYEELQLLNAAKSNIGAKAARIVREARSTGFTLVLAAQELRADTVKKIPGGGSLKNNMSSLILGKASFGSLMSALKSPVEAPDLGDSVPRGRGIFESSKSKPIAIQSWFDDSHVASMVAHITAVRPPLPEYERADLRQYLSTTTLGPVFGEVLPGDDADEFIDVPGVEELEIDFTAPPVPPEVVTSVDMGKDFTGSLVLFAGDQGVVTAVAEMVARAGVSDAAVAYFGEVDATLELPLILLDGLDGSLWSKANAVQGFLEAHPSVDRFIWIDDDLSEVDQIGVPLADLARDVARATGRLCLLVEPRAGDISAVEEFLAPPAPGVTPQEPAETPTAEEVFQLPTPLSSLFDEPEILVPAQTVSFD